VNHRFARLAATGLAAAAVALTPATSHAIPTEHIKITVTLDAGSYGATVSVTSLDNATEKFDIDIVRVDSVGPRTAGCTNTNTCHIAADLGSPTAPAAFEVHAVGGQRTLFDNVFDVFTVTTVCTAATNSACTTSPVILAS
jgi:hypothetical protein